MLNKTVRSTFFVIFGVVGMLLLFQHKFIYFPSPYDSTYDRFRIPELIELSYQTGEGKQYAYYIPPASPEKKNPDRLWILFGGNAMLALDWMPFILTHRNQEATGYLLIDYPGYGKNEGIAWPETILESSRLAYQTLFEQYFKTVPEKSTTQVGVLGHSLGAAVALQFATKYPVKQMILTAPFTSLVEMAKLVVGWPLCNLIRKNFDNEATLHSIMNKREPPEITIFHGSKDEIIPVEMGYILYQQFPNKIRYNKIEGGEHNTLYLLAGTKIFREMNRPFPN